MEDKRKLERPRFVRAAILTTRTALFALTLAACTELDPSGTRDSGSEDPSSDASTERDNSNVEGLDAQVEAGGDAKADGDAEAPATDATDDSSAAVAPEDGAVPDASCSGPDCGCDPSKECCTEEQCPAGAACEGGSCRCPSGTHVCGAECVSDTSVASCGTACSPCEAPTGGAAECKSGQCAPTCPSGQRPCAGACIGATVACTGSCPSGSHDCSGACVPNDSVQGCGESSCKPCPTPANGKATCDGKACGFQCSSGYKACNGACIPNAACCSSNECQKDATCVSGTCTCDKGFKKCGNQCIPQASCCTKEDCGANATCTAGACGCASGFKSCKGACIANSQCCSDADCTQGQSCENGSCQTWCGKQTRPSGVAAADYQCLDFEAGLPAASVWSRKGSVTRSTARASSAPASMLATAGMLNWTATGSTPITRISFSAQFSPASIPGLLPPGSSGTLVCLNSGYRNACLTYVSSGDLFDFSQEYPNYTGLYLRLFIGDPAGAALATDCPLPGLSMTANVWTALRFDYDGSAKNLKVTLGSKSASCTFAFGTDTNAEFVLGLDTDIPWSVHYDNVVAHVGR